MKRITINEEQAGLVYKNEQLIDVIFHGKHWFFLGEKIEKINLHEAVPKYSEQFFENKAIKKHLEIITIADDELILVSEKDNFKNVLVPGVYAFWKDKHPFEFQKVSLTDYKIDNVAKVILEKIALQSFVRNYRIESYEKGLLFVDGKFTELLAPGNYYWWRNTQIITVAKGDIRQQTIEVLGQEILTKDKVQLRLNFAVQYRLFDFIKAYIDTKEYDKQLYVLIQMALRTLVGTLTFDELIDQKNEISTLVFEEIKEKATKIGVQVLDSGLKDIILPGEIRDIMNQVLVAEKRAQANSIMRREETAATRSLLNTAKLMEENQMLYKLKEMEYIEKIAEKINSISVSGSNNVVAELKQIFTK